jgi:hypothetical protein
VSVDPREIKGIQRLEDVYKKAMTDTRFRRRLLDDPKKVLTEAGLDVPDDVEVVVHQNRRRLVNLVLPTRLEVQRQLNVESVDIVLISYHWPGI